MTVLCHSWVGSDIDAPFTAFVRTVPALVLALENGHTVAFTANDLMQIARYLQSDLGQSQARNGPGNHEAKL